MKLTRHFIKVTIILIRMVENILASGDVPRKLLMNFYSPPLRFFKSKDQFQYSCEGFIFPVFFWDKWGNQWNKCKSIHCIMTFIVGKQARNSCWKLVRMMASSPDSLSFWSDSKLLVMDYCVNDYSESTCYKNLKHKKLTKWVFNSRISCGKIYKVQLKIDLHIFGRTEIKASNLNSISLGMTTDDTAGDFMWDCGEHIHPRT